ncbi:MAG: type III PLP-dependent enzyme [Planctomycetales bacterium]
MATVLETSSAVTYREAQPVINFEDAAHLAKTYGTPCLAYSRSALIRNYQTMRNCLPNVEFFYAAKANCNHLLLKVLAEQGCSVDVCSYREMVAALEAGFSPNMMIHTHPCKTESNLSSCFAEGVRWFTFDNPNEIEKLRPYGDSINVLTRLSMASRSSVINLSAKFGINVRDAAGLMCQARDAGLNVRGMSFHVGSQCTEPEDFMQALMQARRVWNEATDAGIPLEVLDFGGGFPAPYREKVLTLESYCNSLAQSLDLSFGDIIPSIRVIAEPGRGMCADTVTLVTKVIGKSVRNGMPWYFIDDGLYGSFSGKVFDHTDFPLFAEGQNDRELFPCVVAGPTCDSTDIVAKDQLLPELEIGDLLIVPSMGAYTAASASGFNGLDIAQAVPVD